MCGFIMGKCVNLLVDLGKMEHSSPPACPIPFYYLPHHPGFLGAWEPQDGERLTTGGIRLALLPLTPFVSPSYFCS